MKQNYLGEFEELLLLAILFLSSDAYGVTIKKAIEEKTKRGTSYGAIYSTLERLEKKGYVSPRMGEATCERGGRAKRFYRVEGAGLQALKQAESARRALASSASGILAGGAA